MLTDTMEQALKEIDATSGTVVLDKYGRVICSGKVLSFGPATILRLCMYGYMDAFSGHAYVNASGREAISDA